MKKQLLQNSMGLILLFGSIGAWHYFALDAFFAFCIGALGLIIINNNCG